MQLTGSWGSIPFITTVLIGFGYPKRKAPCSVGSREMRARKEACLGTAQGPKGDEHELAWLICSD